VVSPPPKAIHRSEHQQECGRQMTVALAFLAAHMVAFQSEMFGRFKQP